MTKLIYHKTETLNDISPFDIAITDLVKDKEIKIACPYINIYYLEKLIKLSKKWILITDVNEWVFSNKSKTQAQNVIDFIEKNNSKIKHYPSLHAKTIISDNQIFLGSSNFTDNGIFKKNELSVVISDKEKVDELNIWFENWWKLSDTIQTNELKLMIKDIPNFFANDFSKLLSKTPKIRTKTVQGYNNVKDEQNVLPITEIEINNYLEKWNNIKWEYGFFELMRTAIDLTLLKKESEYLALTLNKSMQITFQINNRIVLKSHSSGELNSVGFILPLEFENEIKNYKNIHKIEYFTHKKVRESLLVRFLYEDLANIDNKIIKYWKSALEDEMKRKHKSPYKKYHQNIIYDIALDKNRLYEILENSRSTV